MLRNLGGRKALQPPWTQHDKQPKVLGLKAKQIFPYLQILCLIKPHYKRIRFKV